MGGKNTINNRKIMGENEVANDIQQCRVDIKY